MSSGLFDLTGKIALVTGASRGLGAGMALALADAGADVAIHASTQPPSVTETAIKAKGRQARSFTANLGKRDETARLIPSVLEAFGRIDILVNNAATMQRAPAAKHPDEMWDETIEVNLSSVFLLSRAAGVHMLERGKGGKIINIASMLSFQGGITVPSYAAAKGGVAQLTKAFANEWAAHRINVNAIAPGYMATDNTSALQADPVRSRQIGERIPAGRWGKPEDLGGAVVFLSSRASDYVNGHVLVVDGGWLGR
jgi:2-dehydro-3-deoxy-D-gluconate 5-dehydrogenase